uniref:Uncharacterized protein n=1 Tax=viral metagenome TaxID=1070528 RepID=A0A6M3J9A2_9ZZZZ
MANKNVKVEKPDTVVTLDSADYWRLMALQARAEAAKALAELAHARGLLNVQAAGGKAAAVYDELAPKYGLDVKVAYVADDAACAMKPQPA